MRVFFLQRIAAMLTSCIFFITPYLNLVATILTLNGWNTQVFSDFWNLPIKFNWAFLHFIIRLSFLEFLPAPLYLKIRGLLQILKVYL